MLAAQTWGSTRYGDPCRECGFTWGLDPADAIDIVADIADAYDERLADATGRERHPDLDWSVAGYVCHATDNLRIWAERLAGAVDGGDLKVTGYDADALASARRYLDVSLAGALWSLRWAAEAWVEIVDEALTEDVVLDHDERGPQRAEDVARNNAHDAYHHLWDVSRILDYAGLRTQNNT